MQSINPDHIAQIIKDVAAEKIAPRFQQLAAEEIQQKSGPTDLVTIADIEAEIELTRILTALLPGSMVVGEEAVSKGQVSREILQQSDVPVWVVDPVDGTNNFAHGRPVFGTMVALVKGGESVLSWIYQIPQDRMVIGERHSGIRIDGRPLPAIERAGADAGYAAMKAFISQRFLPPKMRPYIQEQIGRLSDATTFMCCAWEYVRLLEGHATFSIYKRIEPWDHLAGALLLEEAGFSVRKWDGSPYCASDLSGGLINAPNAELWERIYKDFMEVPLQMVRSGN